MAYFTKIGITFTETILIFPNSSAKFGIIKKYLKFRVGTLFFHMISQILVHTTNNN